MGKKEFLKYAFALFAVTITSCSTSKFVVNVINPPSIEITDDIERILIANRCLRDEYDNPNDIIEGLIEGEGPVINQAGAKKAVDAVIADIRYAPGLEPVYIPTVPRADTLDDKFPQPLDWETVNNMCIQYKSDALLTLEVFSAQTYIDYGYFQRPDKENEVKVWSNTKIYNRKVNQIPLARLRVEITAGWRIYYPLEKKIVVNELNKHKEQWEFEGKTKKMARRNLPSKMFAVEAAAKIAGANFSSRLYPERSTVERILFIKGNRDFRIANHYLKQRYWEKAASIWKKHTDDKYEKTASAALYNLAVINEMEGNIEKAFELAQQAGEINNERVIKDYTRLLEKKAKVFRE